MYKYSVSGACSSRPHFMHDNSKADMVGLMAAIMDAKMLLLTRTCSCQTGVHTCSRSWSVTCDNVPATQSLAMQPGTVHADALGLVFCVLHAKCRINGP